MFIVACEDYRNTGPAGETQSLRLFKFTTKDLAKEVCDKLNEVFLIENAGLGFYHFEEEELPVDLTVNQAVYAVTHFLKETEVES